MSIPDWYTIASLPPQVIADTSPERMGELVRANMARGPSATTVWIDKEVMA
jgi:hypothetical protein